MDFLTPARRQVIYAALVAVGAVVTVTGLATESVVAGWVGVAQAALGVAALVMAAAKAKTVEWTTAYTVFAAFVVAVKTTGLLSEGVTARTLDVAAAVAAAAPLVWAAARTSPVTPTGEPVAEYTARRDLPPLTLP